VESNVAMNFLSFLLFVAIVCAVAVFKHFVQIGVHRWVTPWLLRGMMRSQLFDTFRFTPWLFEPIAAQDLPRHHRSFFELYMAAFLKQGFQPLGDFVLRRDPAPSCSRYFLSPCRTILGVLSHYLDTKSISYVSITLDGLYMETGNTPIDNLPPIEHGLQFFILPSNDPAAILELHRRSAGQAAAQRRSELAQIEPDDVRTVLNYGRELSLRSLHQQGILPEVPAFLREQAATPADAR
jgi:hypothetical protein